jgi:hypothetical protein
MRTEQRVFPYMDIWDGTVKRENGANVYKYVCRAQRTTYAYMLLSALVYTY